MSGGDFIESELVHVGPDATVYRRTLSQYDQGGRTMRILGILGASIGGAAIATGATFLPLGLARDHQGMTVAGGISLGAGALLTTLGIVAIAQHPKVYRAGAASHYAF